MKLKFPIHFQVRLTERGIDIDHIKQAIRKPDSKHAMFEGRIAVVRKIDGKTIKVVYFKDGFRDKKDEYIVITAYYLEK